MGSITGALISDFGNVWNSGGKLPEWVLTAGYEVKIALQADKMPLLYFAIGQAQTIDEWNNDEMPQNYFRLALINPF